MKNQIKKNEIEGIAQQLQKLDDKQFAAVSFLIDGFLLRNKMGDSNEIRKINIIQEA